MQARFHALRLKHLDTALAQWRDATLPARPPSGWIRAIRAALGMSSTALAARLDITDSAVRKLEASETQDAIALATLRRVAEALGCELQYALVPWQTLNSMRSDEH